MSNGPEEKKSHRCKATTKSGKPCQAAATEGGLYYFHANPAKASELGRIGGRRNRKFVDKNLDPLPRLDNALAEQNFFDRLIVDVYTGKLDPRTAAALGSLLNFRLRAIAATDLERQIADLKAQLPEPDLTVVGNCRTGPPHLGSMM
jgi:hypothetical protein